jgi:hypothetical protein
MPLLTFSSPASAGDVQASQGQQPASSSASLQRLVDFNLRGRSFRYDINGYLSAPGSNQANVVGTGEVDTSTQSVHVSGTLGLPSSGFGFSTGTNLPGPTATFRVIETTRAEYIGGRLFAPLLPAGATWASIDYAQLSLTAASFANSVPNIEDNVYPMLQILRLPGTGVAVIRSSSGTLDGSKLSYYRVSINPSRLTNRINGSTLSEADKIRITSVLGWSAITCYIGFDSTGRLRQVNDLASTSVGNMTLKLDMVENTSTWTHPTRIGAPPASEVYDRTQMVNSGVARLNPGTIQTV